MRNEFVEWLCEQLSPMGHMSSRAMFGGWSVYCDGLIFAIVVDEVPYLKADAQTIPTYTEQGCGPFEYSGKDGKLSKMNYYRIPDEVLEERGELLQWARAALEVALRARSRDRTAKAPKARKPAVA